MRGEFLFFGDQDKHGRLQNKERVFEQQIGSVQRCKKSGLFDGVENGTFWRKRIKTERLDIILAIPDDQLLSHPRK